MSTRPEVSQEAERCEESQGRLEQRLEVAESRYEALKRSYQHLMGHTEHMELAQDAMSGDKGPMDTPGRA